MGLLGFFFNKRFLKLVFIFASIFLFLEFLTLSVSFVSGLSWSLQVILASFTLLVLIFFATRFERFRFLSGLTKFLSFTAVPLILAFNFVLPVSIPYPVSAPVKLGTLALPFLAYIAYRRKSLTWKSLSVNTMRRRSGKLSRDILLPKALEEGHILYDVGIRGFKVIRFIEVKDQQPDSINEHIMNGHQLLAATAALSERLTVRRRCRIEMSYEFYIQNESLQCFIGLANEGRNYRKIRTKIDEFSKELTSGLKSTHKTLSATSCPIEDNNQAEKILMMPLFVTSEDLKQISNDEYNVKISTHSNAEKPIKLRSIHLVGLSTIKNRNDINLVGEFVKTALAHRPPQNFALILHIRPLSDRDIQQDLKRTGSAYQRAMTHFVEGMREGLLNGKSRSVIPLFGRESIATDPVMIIEETKTRFRCLKGAQESGYFEVGLTVIGEPASAESIARALKNKLPQSDPGLMVSLVRSLPGAIRGVIRRDLTLPLARLNGDEVNLLMTYAHRSSESTTGERDDTPRNHLVL